MSGVVGMRRSTSRLRAVTLLAGTFLYGICSAPAQAAVSADIQHLPFRRSVTLVDAARTARAIIEEDHRTALTQVGDFGFFFPGGQIPEPDFSLDTVARAYLDIYRTASA